VAVDVFVNTEFDEDKAATSEKFEGLLRTSDTG